MKFWILLRMAYWNLLVNRMRTTITTVGVTVGIASIIFLVSLGYGLEGLVTKQITQFSAFTVIDVPAANLKTLKINQELVDKTKSLAHLKSVGRISTIPGRIKEGKDSASAEVVVNAAEKDYWDNASILTSKGRLPEKVGELVVNQPLLSLLSSTEENIVGKKVSLDMLIPKELFKDAPDTKEVKDKQFEIVGLIGEGSSPNVFISLENMSAEGVINFTSLKLKAQSQENIDVLRAQLENFGLSTEYIGDTVKQIAQVFSFFRIILAAFGLIALIVAAMGAFNVLTINLLERIKEVGLMKALGMKNNEIYKLFLIEAVLISLIGGIIGLALGYSLGITGNAALGVMADRNKVEAVRMFETPFMFAAGVTVFSVVVGFFTGLYPARKAVKINAIDALRFE